MPNTIRQRLSLGILWLLVLALPFYQLRWNVFGIPATALELIILLCAVLSLLLPDNKTLKERISLFFTIEHKTLRWSVIAFFVAVTLALLVTRTTAAAGIWKAYVVDALIAGLTIQIVSKYTNMTLRTITAASAVLLAIIGTVALLQWWNPSGIVIGGREFFAITDPNWSSRSLFRATSVFDYPNAVGLIATPLLLLIIGWIAEFRATKLSAIGLVLGLLAVVLANSRGAVLAVVGGLLGFVVLEQFQQSLRVRLVSIFFIAWALLPLLPIGSLIPHQWLKTNPSGVLRIEQFRETAQLLMGSPVLGGGLANYQQSIAPYHNTERSGPPLLYPHNFLLALWTEFGLLGVTSMLALMALTIRRLARSQTASARILLGAWIALLAHGLVDVPYFKNDLSALFWILLFVSWQATQPLAHPQPS